MLEISCTNTCLQMASFCYSGGFTQAVIHILCINKQVVALSG